MSAYAYRRGAYQRGETNLTCVLKEGESTRGDQFNLRTERGRINEGGGDNLICTLNEGKSTTGEGV